MIKAFIVDDESKGIEIMRILIEKHCPDVKVIGHAEEIDIAVQLISEMQPDLVLLDIEMSEGNGFDMLKKIKNKNFHVIFVTAHSEYAVRAFRYSVTDYLLKPVDVTEMKEAIDKVRSLMKDEQKNAPLKILEKNFAKATLKIPLQQGSVFVKIKDIIRFEADGSYTRIFISGDKEYLASHNVKVFEEHLDMNLFMRVHRSHIINLSKVCKISGGRKLLVEMSDTSKVEISRRAKNDFMKSQRRINTVLE
jgi:two-component system LytT family response regulator